MTARNDFDGTSAERLVTSAALGDGEFTVSGTTGTITEFDNSGASDKWTSAKLVLSATYDADPGDNTTIDIYRWETSIDGSNDELAPSLDEANAAVCVGSFKVPNDVATAAFYLTTIVSLVGVKKCKFAISPNNGSTMELESGATLDVEGYGFNDT